MGNVKIGIDLHNLSLKTDSIVRTGIQQVVFNLLEAQYFLRKKNLNNRIELIPIPLLSIPMTMRKIFLTQIQIQTSQLILQTRQI